MNKLKTLILLLVFISFTNCENSNKEAIESNSTDELSQTEIYDKMKAEIYEEYMSHATLVFLKHNIDSIHHRPLVENYIELFTNRFFYLDIGDEEEDAIDWHEKYRERKRLRRSNIVSTKIKNLATKIGLSSSVIAAVYLDLNEIVFYEEFNY